MKYYSTKNTSLRVSFQEAIFKGLPEDNGLFMPVSIPELPDEFFDHLASKSLQEIGFEVMRPFTDAEIDDQSLRQIVSDTLQFDIPLKRIHDSIFSLELFHGPTLAFKDVGARFLARSLSHFTSKQNKNLTVLVATSGDTGSAVANGFFNVPGIEVIILYPEGKVSHFQEQQMTTLGGNIIALKVDGTFDDCQRLVKSAFLDTQLSESRNLTSANSINVARFLPQSIYYFYAVAQLRKMGIKERPVFSIPSGNYGNLTAGLIAHRMGLPIAHLLACSNINDTVPSYLESGSYDPKESQPTVSNAMDVGDPSNFVRMLDLFDGSHQNMLKFISGYSCTDEETIHTISKVNDATGYILDPHGAVGYYGLEQHNAGKKQTGIVLETAHPVKFSDTVEHATSQKVDLPSHVELTNLKSTSIPFSSSFSEFREFLLEGKS